MLRLFYGAISQRTSQACLVDSTPPVFSGITSAAQRPNGSLRATWSAATDSNPPIRYRVFIAVGVVSAAVLFQTSNRVATVEPSGAGPFTFDVYSLADQITYLGINQTYTMGVRAVDALGNEEFNAVVMTAVSLGVLPDALTATAASLAATQSALSQNVADLDVIESDLAQNISDLDIIESDLAQSVLDLDLLVSQLDASIDDILTTIAASSDSEIVGIVDDSENIVGEVEENET